MSRGVSTVDGQLICALARRDRENFDRWYMAMTRNEQAKVDLYDMYYTVFRDMALLRFPVGCDLRKIARFLAEPLVAPFPKLDLPLLEAEAIIRSARGEKGLVGGISHKDAMEMRMQLIVHLTESLALTDQELCDLVARAEAEVMARSAEATGR